MSTIAEDQKVLYLHIPKEVHKQLKTQAAEEETSMKEIILNAIAQYIGTPAQ